MSGSQLPALDSGSKWQHGGPAYANPAGYVKDSPLSHAEKWKTPMLVIHGGKDYRVVDAQGISTISERDKSMEFSHTSGF